ncbi:MAG: TrmH family RNA methyltransferase [Clostridia bacterium]
MEESSETRDLRVKPYKKDFTYSYTEGVFPTIELIEHAPETVLRIIVSSKSSNNSGVAFLKEKCCAFHIPLTEEDHTIARICPKGSVMAVGIFRKTTADLDPGRNHAVFVNPADMGNLGTILRTAAAFGIFDVAVIEPAADYYDPKAIRASMGAFFRLRIRSYPSFADYRAASGERDLYPFMLKGRDLEDFTPISDMSRPRSLIFGNESRGLDDSFRTVGTPLRIRHLDTVDSLNLTIAAGIAMHWHYEAFKD